jgi:hypothetical protein
MFLNLFANITGQWNRKKYHDSMWWKYGYFRIIL